MYEYQIHIGYLYVICLDLLIINKFLEEDSLYCAT